MNSETYHSGRIEVRRANSSWGTVCDDYFNNTDATVVCNMLGFPSGIARTNAYFGRGNGSIWIDNLSCTGHERSIFDCEYSGWGLHDCSHSEDAGVECSG